MNARNTIRIVVAISLVAVLFSGAEGEEASLGAPLKADPQLADYLAYAALHNPGLEAAFNQWRAALEEIPQATSLPNPKLTFAYFIEEVETRVGPQEQKIGLSQMFPWFGTLRLRGDVAAEAANAMVERYEAVKLKLFYDVKRSYYEYYYLSRALGISRDHVQLLRDLESVARSKQKAGASVSGVIKAQVELGKMEDRVRSLQALQAPRVAELNAALNRPHDAPLSPPRAPVFGSGGISEDEIFARLAMSNPDLKAMDHLIVGEERAIALARQKYFPNLILGFNYVSTGDALMSDSPDSGKDPMTAMVALDLPIWHGKYRAGERQARWRRDAAEKARQDQENRIESSLKMALYRFRDAERKVNLYGETLISQARQSLKVTEEVYRTGSVDFLSLIDAERLYLEFHLAHARALVNREIAVAEIEMLVGRPLVDD